jgi:hypothetical protein
LQDADVRPWTFLADQLSEMLRPGVQQPLNVLLWALEQEARE